MSKNNKLFIFKYDKIVEFHKGQHNLTDIFRILDISRITVIGIISK